MTGVCVELIGTMVFLLHVPTLTKGIIIAILTSHVRQHIARRDTTACMCDY